MDNLSFLLGLNANNGGGTASTPTWSDVTGKPFDTIGTGLTVTAGALETVGGTSGATPTWSEITSKPFSTVDTTTGLTIVNDTLMLETLDHVATIDYVDQQIDGITTTLESDYALKSELPTVPTNVSSFNNDAGYVTSAITTGLATESYVNGATTAVYNSIPDVSSFITASALTPYAESANLATVATSGLYSDLSGAPTIPVISATSTLATGTQIGEIEIDGATTTFYAPAGGGTAPTPNWNATSGQSGYIENKPPIKNGTMGGAVLVGDGGVSGNGAMGFGHNVYAKGLNTIVIGKDIMNNYAGQYSNDPNMFFGDGVNPYTTSPTIPTMYRGYKNLNWNDISNPQVNYLDILGNGTASNSRNNAEATDWSGNKYLAGDVYVGVSNWASPTTGAACIPKEADLGYANSIGAVDNYELYTDAVTTYSGGGVDPLGNNEYLGVSSEFSFKCSLDENGNKRYYWYCDSAEAELNPDYDPNAEPEDGGEEEPTEGE